MINLGTPKDTKSDPQVIRARTLDLVSWISLDLPKLVSFESPKLIISMERQGGVEQE
jgi:hypothetical protein